jgi:hypothetical protein
MKPPFRAQVAKDSENSAPTTVPPPKLSTYEPESIDIPM